MAVSGTMLMYRRQVTAWSDRDFRSTRPSNAAARLTMEEDLAKVCALRNASPTAVTLRADPNAPIEASYGSEHVFFIDAYSGEVLGEGSSKIRTFYQHVEEWHRWLGTSREYRTAGRAVTGACNLGLLILVASGPFLWLPRKWSWSNVRAVTVFRGDLTGKARDFNWHNVIGIWCAVPLFVIVLSGVIMSYPWANNLLYRLSGNVPPQQTAERRLGSEGRAGRSAKTGHDRAADGHGDAAGLPGLRGVDALWVRAEQRVPGWQSITMRLPPGNGEGPVTFAIDRGNGGRPDQRSQLILDRATGEVVRWAEFSGYNAGRQLRGWFRFLHTGEAGGLPGQTIAGVASAGAAVLVWTGLWLACRRLVRWRRAGQG
jgi:uncharacterized iron-regulated membrane protein